MLLGSLRVHRTLGGECADVQMHWANTKELLGFRVLTPGRQRPGGGQLMTTEYSFGSTRGGVQLCQWTHKAALDVESLDAIASFNAERQAPPLPNSDRPARDRCCLSHTFRQHWLAPAS